MLKKLVARSLLVIAALWTSACATYPSEVDVDSEFVVVCKSARLPAWMPWYSQFAEHGWFDLYDGSEWLRIEVLSRSSGVVVRGISDEEAVSDVRFETRDVHVHAVYRGDVARRMIPAMHRKAREYPWQGGYEPWPGPNSNTFVEWMSHQVPGLWVEQYGTALGKDYPSNGWVQAGVTATRTGLELETPYVGLQAGLTEGLELHLLGLTLGVDLWPPQLKLPFLPAIPWQF